MRTNYPGKSCAEYQLQPISLTNATNVLSVDLEPWPGSSCRDELLYLLELFRNKNVRATFFVLGSVAQTEPDLLKRIDAEGHEIASHGWQHVQLFKITPEQFRVDMDKSISLLYQIVGKPVLGFRAPHFSIMEESFWALDVLVELGIRYDSSIFPIRGPRYGMPDFPPGPVRINCEGGSIIEVPLSTVRMFGKNWPVAGGGYFRLLPYPIINCAVKTVNSNGLPFVVYCHPYEFRAERLRCSQGFESLNWFQSKKTQLKFNIFRTTMRGKLSRLLDMYPFKSFREVLSDELRC